MKKYYKYLVLLLVPFFLGLGTSRYGPWWGLREQATTPDTPSNGIKIYADANNNLFSLHESGSTTQLNSPNSLGDPTSIGTLSVGSGSITDSSGAVDFGNENLSTTGTFSAGNSYFSDYIYHTGDTDTAWYFRADRATLYAGGRTLIDAVEVGANTYMYLGYDGANAVDVSIGPNAAISIEGSDGIVTLQNVLRTATSKWYYCKYIDAIAISPGGSGATLAVPDTNTLGGYQLDAANEYVYFDARTCSNWDAASDLYVKITFEVNVDNSGGNAGDTVDLSLLSYFKGDGETSNKSQTNEIATTVGQSAQYKQFTSTHTIDYDDPNNTVDTNDVFAVRVNLETDTSEVDNIIINFIVFTYQTKKVHVEI